MKLTGTKLNKLHSVVELGVDTGVYLKALPVSKLQKYFKTIEQSLIDNPEETVNKLFDKLIVDADGNKFDDLVDAKATDVLPVETIKVIMAAIPEALNPSPKQ